MDKGEMRDRGLRCPCGITYKLLIIRLWCEPDFYISSIPSPLPVLSSPARERVQHISGSNSISDGAIPWKMECATDHHPFSSSSSHSSELTRDCQPAGLQQRTKSGWGKMWDVVTKFVIKCEWFVSLGFFPSTLPARTWNHPWAHPGVCMSTDAPTYVLRPPPPLLC